MMHWFTWDYEKDCMVPTQAFWDHRAFILAICNKSAWHEGGGGI